MPDILLKNKNGESVTYEGIETVTFDTPTQEKGATFIYGSPVETEVELDFSEGNQTVTPEEATFFTSVLIKKPETLVEDNIRKDVNIAGKIGTFIGNAQEIEVDLAMADGDQVLVPTEGYLFSKVTVKKPETYIPENIAKDVDIGGVVGELTGGGVDFDCEDEILKYLVYQLDPDNRTIIVSGVMYWDIFADTGKYDITIPDTIGGYSVAIRSWF